MRSVVDYVKSQPEGEIMSASIYEEKADRAVSSAISSILRMDEEALLALHADLTQLLDAAEARAKELGILEPEED